MNPNSNQSNAEELQSASLLDSTKSLETSNFNTLERQKNLEKQMSMSEKYENNADKNEIDTVMGRLNDNYPTTSRMTSDARTEGRDGPVKLARKYTRSKPMDRQKSLPEFSSRVPPKTIERYLKSPDETNISNINSPERQNMMPESTSRNPIIISNFPRKDKNYFDTKFQNSTKTVCSDNVPKMRNPTEHNIVHKAPQNVQRQKTVPEYSRTSKTNYLQNTNNSPSPLGKKTTSRNAPADLRHDPISHGLRLIHDSNTGTKNQKKLSIEPKSPISESVPSSIKSEKTSKFVPQYVNSISSSTPKAFRRQNSLPETSVIPNSKNQISLESVPLFEETPMSVNNDIQNRKLKYENDSLDLNKRMRRQKADLRTNEASSSGWKSLLDTKSYAPSVTNNSAISSRPSTSKQSNHLNSTRTTRPTQNIPRTESLTSRTPTSTSSNRNASGRSHPSRKFSIDSALGNKLANSSADPLKSTNWQDEARNQVWRGYMQRMKNLDSI